jgi:xanthine/uracil permease
MMGVTFAAVAHGGDGQRKPGRGRVRGLIFGAIIGAGVISILIAPIVSRMLRFFPPVVTGTIIAMIGISLMRVGINWIFGDGPDRHPSSTGDAQWLASGRLANASVTAPARRRPAPQPFSGRPGDPKGLAWWARYPTRSTRSARTSWHCRPGAGLHPADAYAKGFVANISVLLGIVIGCVVATW